MDAGASGAAARPEGGAVWVRFGERPPDTLARWIVAWTVAAVATGVWMVLSWSVWVLAAVGLLAAVLNTGRNPRAEVLVVAGVAVLWAAGTVAIIYSALSFYRRVRQRWQPSGALSGTSAPPTQHAP